MLCAASQDKWVMVEGYDKMWSTGERNGKPLQYSCLENPINSMTNLDSILKSRDITLPAKVHLVRTMVFPVVMYGCESWTIKEMARMIIDILGSRELKWTGIGEYNSDDLYIYYCGQES